MAAERWNRDEILANYQAASSNEDIASCINILESHQWDLQAALNAHFMAQENENQGDHDMDMRPSGRSPSPIDVDTPPIIDLTPDVQPLIRPDTQSFGQFRDLTSDDGRKVHFQIIWQDKTFPVSVHPSENVGTLKRMLELQTGFLPESVMLEGWPSGDSNITDNTVLSTLNLFNETHLILHLPGKVTVSPAEYKPCNIPACRSPTSRRSASPDSPPRIIDVEIGDRPDNENEDEITLNVNYEQRDYRLRYRPQQTVKVVKQELFLLTKMATRFQEWTGWPEGTTDQSKLGDLELSQPDHFLLLSSLPTPSSSASLRPLSDIEKHHDSGMAGSPEDTDFEEHIISDSEDAIFDTEATASKRLTPLLPRDSSDSSESIIKLQYQFEERYGDFHPAFFMGPLKNAVDEAGGATIEQRRPLLIYLHHDGSVLTNIFCSQILCSEQVVTYISQNFVIWPWDMTFESNRQRFVNMLVQHFGNTAANTVSKFRDGEYPLMLIVMKSKAGLEVCSVLQANTSLDELMMALINGYEVFEQTKNIEVKAENERLERDLMKREQDAAYYESLAADRAKKEAEDIKIKQEYEMQKQEQMQAQIKEAERISCIEQLTEEPPKTAKEITNILFRFPDGGREARRFNGSDKIKSVFMYVASKGFSLDEHKILTNFPRRQITEDSQNQTLKEGRLFPQETLFIEEI